MLNNSFEDDLDPTWSKNTSPPPPSYHSEKNYDKSSSPNESGEAIGMTKIDLDVAKAKEKDKEEEKKLPPVGIFQLYRHASGLDRVLILFGLLSAIVCGCGLAVMVILFGDILNAFVTNEQQSEGYSEQLKEQVPECFDGDNVISNCTSFIESVAPEREDFLTVVARFGIGNAIIGLAMWILSYFFVTCLNYAAENQVFKIRNLFLRSILRQDIGWYDTTQTGDFASRMTDDLNKLQEGIGEKIGMSVFFITIFLASLINAFIHGWELTLVILAAMPVLSISSAALAKVQTALTEKELDAYGKAAAVAEEVLSSIRTVVAFGGQKKEVERYSGNLVFARRSGILRGMLTGVSGGVVWFIIFCSYALAFWYGVKLIMDDRDACLENPTDCETRYDPKSLLIVFFSVLMGAMQLGMVSPYIEAFSVARSAAAGIFAVIDRVPPIDSFSKEGQKPENVYGNIEFRNVSFNYPSRPDVKVLQELSFSVRKGETVALVGSSGSGKSTCIQLVQRFYDPDYGQIMLDGNDLKKLNVGWLRDHIGIVGQEPVLFGCSIRENIKYGNVNVTDHEIEEACKSANAYDFVSKLPSGLDTLVGERGAQLSGGQKQRIAIARALVKNPRILLLDEATSALDLESEASVQEALDKARQGRTTIIVAHRLSTIRNADKIYALRHGVLEEEGTHDKLMANKGYYFSLVTHQMHSPSEAGSSENDGEKSLSQYSEAETDEMDELADRKLHESRRESQNISRRLSRLLSTSESVKNQKSHDVEANREEDKKLPKVSQLRIWKKNGPEAHLILVGGLAACCMGAVMPVFAILFGEVLGILGYQDAQKARDESVTYAIYFIIVGVASGIAMFLQSFMFAISGENLTMRLRSETFAAMLRQEMGWFDKTENGTGNLCARLSGDASSIQGATGSRVGTVLQSIFTLIIGLAISFYYSWKLALVAAVFLPVLIGGIYLQTKIIMGHDSVEKEAFEKSAHIAIEAISNIRTVAGLRCEEKFLKHYKDELTAPHKLTVKKSHMRGLVFGFAQAAPFFAYGTVMYYGGYLVKHEGLSYSDAFKVAEALILGAFTIGQSVAFAPDYQKAVLAARRIFNLLDRKSEIDSCNHESGQKLSSIKGDTSYQNAQFHYPTRPNVKVLSDLNLFVGQSQSIALVGSSGCGKSTCIQLLLRFYNLDKGEVTLDDENIAEMNVPWLQTQLGLVSQEPVLFDRTIAENIMYGDNSREVTLEEVINAAKRANIHDFVSGLPLGYDTSVGERGAQLSGGQKQRVAIARALVRHPKILLLDEATSALDTESERIVQDALDKAQENTTSITIAHRLSTVKNCDRILVLDGGKVVESGTHDELIEAKGRYFNLWTTQH